MVKEEKKLVRALLLLLPVSRLFSSGLDDDDGDDGDEDSDCVLVVKDLERTFSNASEGKSKFVLANSDAFL